MNNKYVAIKFDVYNTSFSLHILTTYTFHIHQNSIMFIEPYLRKVESLSKKVTIKRDIYLHARVL